MGREVCFDPRDPGRPLAESEMDLRKCLLEGGGPVASDIGKHQLSKERDSVREGTEAGGSREKTIEQVKLQQQGVHCGNGRCREGMVGTLLDEGISKTDFHSLPKW